MQKHTASIVWAGIVSVVLAAAASAQAVTAGVKGGLNSSETGIPLAASVERGRASGFHAAGFVAFHINRSIALQVEGLYTQKGFSGTRRDADLNYELEAGYLEIPILGKLRFQDAVAGMTPYFFAGPALGLELSCDLTGKQGDAYLFYLCDGPPVHFDKRQKVDIGVMLGAGIEMPVGVGSVIVDLAYDRGVRDLGDRELFGQAVRHGTIMFSMGYSITLGSLAK
jgi:hypothetical protein